MLSQGKELAALDFAQIIGGPLEAVIVAQARAAAVTTNFIQETAFEAPSGGAGAAGADAIRWPKAARQQTHSRRPKNPRHQHSGTM